jgi:hypothetical protein
MVLQIRYIFGCVHPNRNIHSNVFFEDGIKIPVLYCEDCCGICSKCFTKTKTRVFENLELCEECYSNKNKFTS